MSAVDAVVFDIGGVLVDVNYRYLYRQLIGGSRSSSTSSTTRSSPGARVW
ncbi:MAG: hypothetical protein ACR2FF_09055 [Mycobacteriales bacterium]